MKFFAFDLSLEVLRSLRPVLKLLAVRAPNLRKHLEEAASSVSLNLAEGSGRRGKDRQYHYRVALGSAEEARAVLQVAEALGHLEGEIASQPPELLDREIAILWKLLGM